MSTPNGIERTLGRMESRLEEILRRLDEQDAQRRLLADRIGRVEMRTHQWAGAIAIATLIWVSISDTVLTKLGFK